MLDAVVVGGGLSGLSAAWWLLRAGRQVVVLEAEPEPGGHVRTLTRDGFRLDTGPSSFMGSSEHLWRLVDDLGEAETAERAAPASNHRFIFRNERLHPLPLGVWSFLGSRLLSVRGKLRLAMEPLCPGRAVETDTAWEFFRRRFGVEAATYLMSPFVSGVYAGDVHQLGAGSAFRKFWEFERDSGSMILGAWQYTRAKRRRLAAEGCRVRRGLYSFRGGLGRLTRTLAGRLGGRVRTCQTALTIRRDGRGLTVRSPGGVWTTRTVVLAVPPPRASALLVETAPAAAAALAAIPLAPVALVHWELPEARGLPRGFGLLVPRHYGLRTLGTLFPSQLFTGRAPAGRRLFASFYGGVTDPAALELSDDHLTEVVTAEHTRLFGRPLPPPRVLAVWRYPAAIPQLLPDHPARVTAAEAGRVNLPGLALAGNYLTGVGVEHAAESGWRAAEQALAVLNGGSA